MYKYEEVMATAETICSVLDESITNRKGSFCWLVKLPNFGLMARGHCRFEFARNNPDEAHASNSGHTTRD
jgi:hypothetical protein